MLKLTIVDEIRKYLQLKIEELELYAQSLEEEIKKDEVNDTND